MQVHVRQGACVEEIWSGFARWDWEYVCVCLRAFCWAVFRRTILVCGRAKVPSGKSIPEQLVVRQLESTYLKPVPKEGPNRS